MDTQNPRMKKVAECLDFALFYYKKLNNMRDAINFYIENYFIIPKVKIIVKLIIALMDDEDKQN